MRKVAVFVTVAAAVAAAVMVVGGFLAVVGTVKMFMWAGVAGAVAYWAVLVLAMVALMHKLPSQGAETGPAAILRQAWWWVLDLRFGTRLRMPRPSRR